MKTINDILEIQLQTFNEKLGSLVAIESDGLMKIERIFYVFNTPKNITRGKHSHYKTKQLLICLNGKCEVICDDGVNREKYLLDSPKKGLLIPEGIWAEETYKTIDTMLMVICNTTYSEEDYIYDYDKFIKEKNNK